MFLTDLQVEILKLKKKGLRPTDISRIMKTTRANICTVEKTALKNIEKAKNTIKFYQAFEAPIWLSFPAGTDLYDIPDDPGRQCDETQDKTYDGFGGCHG